MPIQAREHALYPHSRIHHDRDGADFEQGKGQCKKLEARSDHENGFHSPVDTRLDQPVGKTVGFAVQLAKRQVAVCHPSMVVACRGCHHGPAVGLNPRHGFKVVGHVDGHGGGLFIFK